jgi:hypothetical protein
MKGRRSLEAILGSGGVGCVEGYGIIYEWMIKVVENLI